MDEIDLDEQLTLLRACRRQLSGVRPLSMGETLAWLRDQESIDLRGRADIYGDGPVRILEERVAALLGFPAAVYFPTGTMAQQVALRCWAQRTGDSRVALHPLGHIDSYERRAYAELTGLQTVITTRQARPATAAEVLAIDEPFGTLVLELPLREAGFVLPTWEELQAVAAAARSRGARVHVDGARLWETTAHFGQPLTEIAGLADSVYVSLYKSIGALSGAVLAAPIDLANHARAWRHRYGGQLFHQWPAVVSALVGLDTHLPTLPSYVAHAKIVATELARLSGAMVWPDPPHTHQFHLVLPYPAQRLNAAATAMAKQESIWLCSDFTDVVPGRLARAEITVAGPALEWSVDEIAQAVSAFQTYVDG